MTKRKDTLLMGVLGLLALAVVLVGWAAISFHNQSNALQKAENKVVAANHQGSLRDHESLRHLQSRVNFLDHALDLVCKEAALPCPPPFPNVKPIPKPTGGTSGSATAVPTPSESRASPSGEPTATPSPSPTPTPVLCIGSFCIG
jgi:hypothetical protein